MTKHGEIWYYQELFVCFKLYYDKSKELTYRHSLITTTREQRSPQQLETEMGKEPEISGAGNFALNKKIGENIALSLVK